MAKKKKAKKRGSGIGSASGRVAAKVRSKLYAGKNAKVVSLDEIRKAKEHFSTDSPPVKTPGELLEEGRDPLWSLYAGMQNVMSLFAEHVAVFPELKKFYLLHEKTEDFYMPSYPPMSPVTSSYYNTWLLWDARFGLFKETMGDVFLSSTEVLGFNEEYKHAAKILCDSRMGIYVHCGHEGEFFIIRELLTDAEHRCINQSGYSGKEGELWFARMVPSPYDFIDYNVVLTTPYVLLGSSENDWIEFFSRQGIEKNNLGFECLLRRFMKFGPSDRYWLEYITLAYSNYLSGAVFLYGIPDIPKSLPHSELAEVGKAF